MKKIMILGAGIYQVPLIRAAKKMGLTVIVASIKGDYPGFALADKVYYINTTDREAILKAAVSEKIDGICTTGTDVAVSSIGYVCEQMGLSGISKEAADLVTDKAKMKEAFQKGGVSASDFRKVFSCEEAKNAAEEIGFPVVIKCVDSSGSRGITLVKEAGGVFAAAEQAFSCSKKDYILVEEALSGTEIGVDGVVQDGRLVFLAPHDKFVYKSKKITIPAGHSFPYSGGKAAEKEIRHQMELAVAALGLENCFFNADVFVKGEKVSVIEVGGRTGATCIPELISLYYSFDFYKKILKSAMGEKPDFPELQKKRPCMARLLMSPKAGVLTSVDEKRLKKLQEKGVLMTLDFPEGYVVEKMENGTNRLGHLVAEVENIQEFERLLREAYSAIFVDGVSLEELWNE
ncbi:MAG: ATP-grasp domain-containing protein [Eubacteriales bacterium]|nr:ATP-grasp domain-containing protein [Eubacteriales bacterium]